MGKIRGKRRIRTYKRAVHAAILCFVTCFLSTETLRMKCIKVTEFIQVTFTDVFVYFCLFVCLDVGLWLNDDVSSCFLISVCLLDLIEQKTATHISPLKWDRKQMGPGPQRTSNTLLAWIVLQQPVKKRKKEKQTKDVIIITTEVLFL